METYRIKKEVIVKIEERDVSFDEYVGFKIQALRKKNKISQVELCEKIGLSRASVSNIEVGRHQVTLKVLKAICKVFNCKSNHILPF
jgi:DNA-binding XRE family transcriptional regulator